jgi:hypothetical protein
MLGSAYNECAATLLLTRFRDGLRHEQKRAANPGGHRISVATNAGQRMLRFLQSHSGERTHCAHDIEQFVHARDMALDFRKAPHRAPSWEILPPTDWASPDYARR